MEKEWVQWVGGPTTYSGSVSIRNNLPPWICHMLNEDGVGKLCSYLVISMGRVNLSYVRWL